MIAISNVNSPRKTLALIAAAVAADYSQAPAGGGSPHRERDLRVFRLGNSADCTSNLLSWAIAVGDEGAHANGPSAGLHRRYE